MNKFVEKEISFARKTKNCKCKLNIKDQIMKAWLAIMVQDQAKITDNLEMIFQRVRIYGEIKNLIKEVEFPSKTITWINKRIQPHLLLINTISHLLSSKITIIQKTKYLMKCTLRNLWLMIEQTTSHREDNQSDKGPQVTYHQVFKLSKTKKGNKRCRKWRILSKTC